MKWGKFLYFMYIAYGTRLLQNAGERRWGVRSWESVQYCTSKRIMFPPSNNNVVCVFVHGFFLQFIKLVLPIITHYFLNRVNRWCLMYFVCFSLKSIGWGKFLYFMVIAYGTRLLQNAGERRWGVRSWESVQYWA